MHSIQTDNNCKEAALAFNRELLAFIQKSPTAFHTVAAIRELLLQAGFTELSESSAWQLSAGMRAFVTRNDASLIAFSIPEQDFHSCRITASHSDSPCFQLKENPELPTEQYLRLNVEPYGGMLCAPWLDRPLSIAGRVFVQTDRGIVRRLVHLEQNLLLIPNVAIHLNRKVNEGYHYQMQTDLLPLMGNADAKGSLTALIAEAADTRPEQILSSELYLYNRCPGSIWGADNAFVSAPRLDDLQCAYATLRGFLEGECREHLALYCIFDNEEVGSSTRQGAASTFLKDTVERLTTALGMTREAVHRMLAESFMLSADNAHAVHPNHPELSDASNRPYINGGIVLKFNANRKYCTDGATAALFRGLCHNAGVPHQSYSNRSDLPGGSTLGNIANNQLPVPTADIGLPQLAMHSPYETAGVMDGEYLRRLCRVFYA